MVSIKDVARVAGVSDKTVSRVVNRELNVSQKTQLRVEKAIAELQYVPNLAARAIRSNSSRIVGILTDFISTTPYSGDIVRGVQQRARKQGFTVLLINTGGDPESEADAWRTFQEHRLQGALYVSMYNRIAQMRSGENSVPTVLVNCKAINSSQFPSVTPNDYQGAVLLTRKVIEIGHRKIAYFRLNTTLLGGNLRYQGFRDVLVEQGISEATIEVRSPMEGPIGHERDETYQEAIKLLKGPIRPTVIMCGNDEIAMQVYLATLSLGLKIPKDLSITGFDDFKTISTALKPGLTTVALPYFDLGYKGADLLFNAIDGQPGTPLNFDIDCAVVLRDSLAAPAN